MLLENPDCGAALTQNGSIVKFRMMCGWRRVGLEARSKPVPESAAAD
jgi:hypothetical protein